jgi:hypothetical protein
MHDEAPSVVSVRICDKDCLPFGIDRCHAAPTPSGFAEIVGSDFRNNFRLEATLYLSAIDMSFGLGSAALRT